MTEAYILAASASVGVSSLVTTASLLGYKIREGWKRYKMHELGHFARKASMARDTARVLEEFGYSEAAEERRETADIYESLSARGQRTWDTLPFLYKLRQAIASGFS